MASPATLITPRELAQRQRAVRFATAQQELEGLAIDGEAAAIFERYAQGEIDLLQMKQEIQALHDRDFGSLSLS